MYKFKIKRGRNKARSLSYHILRDGDAGVYELLKDKISLEELSELIYLFFDEVKRIMLEEKLGFEMPLGIGYLLISGTKEKAYKVGKPSSKLNKGVINPNYHTDGYVFRAWYRYTNDLDFKDFVGIYPNAWIYALSTSKDMRKCIHEKIKSGKWSHWSRFNHIEEKFKKTTRAKEFKLKRKKNDNKKDNF